MANNSTPGSEESDPLQPKEEKMIRNWIETPETMAFLGLEFPVSGVRLGSAIVFILSGGLLGFLMY